MIHGGDSVLARRLSEELGGEIAAKTRELVKSPSDMLAGRIQGMQLALDLMGVVIDKINNPQEPNSGR